MSVVTVEREGICCTIGHTIESIVIVIVTDIPSTIAVRVELGTPYRWTRINARRR